MFRLPIVKFFNRIFNRVTITAVLVALQVLWLLWAFWSFTAGRVWLNGALKALSILIVLYLVRKDENSAYKIGWIVLIGLLPLLGGALYLASGNKAPAKHLRERMQKVEQAHQAGRSYGGDYLAEVTAEALKTAECNACMKRIVAAPTAGSCGVLPAVLLPLARAGEADEEAICDALYVAAGFGQVIAARATLAGAEGGCQAEVGAASAMAAAALCHLKGGTPEQCAAAAAMALGNLLGLVCDPVAGLVEVPCIKRNVVGAVNAVSCANMALAGVDYAIPCDEVIDAMGRVGSLLSPDLRETGQGGLAATPTGVRIAERLAEEA